MGVDQDHVPRFELRNNHRTWGVTFFRFFQKYMIGILLANREQRCAEQFLTCLQTGYGGVSFAIRVQGLIQVGSHPFPRCRPCLYA